MSPKALPMYHILMVTPLGAPDHECQACDAFVQRAPKQPKFGVDVGQCSSSFPQPQLGI